MVIYCAFKGYGPKGNEFPGTLCISINDEVVHGIPGSRKLEEGDIVSVDCGVEMNGYFGDHAFTFAVGDCDDEESRKRAIANKNAWKTRDSKSMAYFMCEDWVKQRLKAPASAEFPGVFDGKLDNIIQTNQRYSIRSYVDSQNSFGAMIRSNFHCVTTQVSDGNWELNRLEIE